jgi:hypothetical protein
MYDIPKLLFSYVTTIWNGMGNKTSGGKMIMNNKEQRILKETLRSYEYFRYFPNITRR